MQKTEQCRCDSVDSASHAHVVILCERERIARRTGGAADSRQRFNGQDGGYKI